MINSNELKILKEILIGKSINEITKMIGFEYNGNAEKDNPIEENTWKEIENDIASTYRKNIQKSIYNKLRKKVELKNAKSGFIVPQNKLIAKEKLPIQNKLKFKKSKLEKSDSKKKKPNKKANKKKYRKGSKSKISDSDYAKKIYLYFQKINYDKELHEIYNSKGRLKKTKTFLKNIFENSDDDIYNKISIAKNFKSLYQCLPFDKEKTKEYSKLTEFRKKTDLKRPQYSHSSVRTISIPMGGQNK